ncbi:MAG: hypothetical protein ACXIUL_09090 [Wenzhouxiangella sp.]
MLGQHRCIIIKVMPLLAIVLYLALVTVMAVAVQGSTGPFLLAAFFLVLAAPPGVFAIYLATLRRAHWLGMWSAGSVGHRLLSGPWLRLLLGTLAALLAAAVMSVRLAVANSLDLVLLAGSLLVFAGVFWRLGAWLRGQYQPLFQHGRSLFWVALIAAAVTSLLDPVVRLLADAFAIDQSLGEAIEQVRGQSAGLGDSAIGQLITRWGSVWGGFEYWALGRLFQESGATAIGAALLSAAGRFPLYASVGFTLCAFLLPAREYQRILLPVSADPGPARLSPVRMAVFSASATVLIVFFYLPLVGLVEANLERRPIPPTAETRLVMAVERIGEHYYPLGTIDEIDRLADDALAERGDLLGPIEAAIGAGFSIMRDNVDSYLDWYYSLPGEWTRLAHLLGGNIEGHLEARLVQALGEGAPFAEFERVLDRALVDEWARSQYFRDGALALLDERRLTLDDDAELEIRERRDLDSLVSFPGHAGLTTLEQRVGATAATSGVSGLVAALATRQIIVRLAARQSFKTAAQALMRLALIRGASTGGGSAGGALIGGTLGSIVPGVGTAIGAVVGGVVGGVAVGVGAEFLIIKLEELWSREEHRQQLIDAIDRAEAEVLEQLGFGVPVDG